MAASSSSSAAVPLPAVHSQVQGWLAIGGARPGYEYGPAIILENGRYHAYYCSSPTVTGWDTIRASTSDDGINWSAPTDALIPQGPWGRVSVCDPSVVKFRGVYFMYVTCINNVDPPDGYQNNRICAALADSPDGPWFLFPGPVVQDTSCSPTDLSAYCVGQPSAVMVNGVIRLYYTETRPGAGGRIYLQESTDGLTFLPANGGNPVWDRYNVDVKYDRGAGRYFLVQGEVDTRDITWAVSADGLWFTPYDAGRTLASNPDLPTGGGPVSNHNPGLAGDELGQFNGMTFVVYGSSYPVTGDTWGHWHLYRSDVVVDPAQTDCSGCVANSCDDGCQKVLGTPATGTCAAPGAPAGATLCCACTATPPPADCRACAAGCVTACRAGGAETGTCAIPGSTDPTACCACQ